MFGLRFVRGLSLVAASGGHSSSRCGDRSSSRCAGLSLSRPLLLWGTGSRRAGSVVVAHGLSRSAACGILPDQGSNPCPLHWQADSQPLRHQGSPDALLQPRSSGAVQKLFILMAHALKTLEIEGSLIKQRSQSEMVVTRFRMYCGFSTQGMFVSRL